MPCKNCKHWEVHFDVEDRQVSPGLTEIRGAYGYCMRADAWGDDTLKLPFWLIEIVETANPPLTTGRYGEYCMTFEEGEPSK